MSTAHLAISHWMPWKSGNGLPEGRPLLHVFGGVHERPFGQADAAGRHDRAHGVEAEHGQAETALPRRSRSPPGRARRSAATRRCRRPCTPILWSVRPTSTPSHSRSTMNAVVESWDRLAGSPLVLAKTVYQSASRDARHPALGAVEDPAAAGAAAGAPPDTPLVRMPMTSLPACGSERPNAARSEPSAIPGRYPWPFAPPSRRS